MSRYDGLIIPRSYSEYINKTDAATLLQALQLSGVMDNAPIANSNHPAKSGGVYTAIQTVDNKIGTWQKIVTLDTNSYVKYKGGQDKMLHLHFQAYLNGETITIGDSIGTIPSGYRPTEQRRGLVDLDMANGRYVANIDIGQGGGINIYPILPNQKSGSIGTIGGLFGDIFIFI